MSIGLVSEALAIIAWGIGMESQMEKESVGSFGLLVY
jgi:hypothetical protein